MIIYLNGTSSSGKTSIALEILKIVDKPVFYFSIDTLLYSLTPSILESIQGKKPYASKIEWGSIFGGYFECVAALARTENHVVADCPVYTEELNKSFIQTLSKIKDLLVVGIDCPLNILQKREKERGDRVDGLAESQHKTIHNFLKYDLEIKSHEGDSASFAQSILKNIKINF